MEPSSLVLDGIVKAETGVGAHYRMNDLMGPHSLESWSVSGLNVSTPARGSRGRARQKAPFGVFTVALRRFAMAMWMCTFRTCKIRREGAVGAKHGMSGMLMLVVRRVFAKLSIGISSTTRRFRYRRNAKRRPRQAWRVLETPLVFRDPRQQKGEMSPSSRCCLIHPRSQYQSDSEVPCP